MANRAQKLASAGESPVLAAALSYADRGLPVFPVNGKRPRTANGLKDATGDAEQLRQWWSRWPEAGVAIRTGEPSGLLVLDVDPDHGGSDSLAELERKHGSLPDTVRCETGGGGEHFYFNHPGGEVRNSAGNLGDGLDTRGDGGYVVAPPSPHPSGGAYAWDVPPDEAELAEPPAWLLEALRGRENGHKPKKLGDAIPPGKRNAELASLAGTMRRRGMDEAAIAAALRETNRTRCRPPLDEDEVDGIAASVVRYREATETQRTDLGNAELLAELHADKLRHVRERNKWLTYRDNRWREDALGDAARAGKETARELLRRAAALNGEEQKLAARWALSSQSESRLRAMLNLAATEPGIVLGGEALDADPYLLAVANGTLDLRTGELRDSDPADLISLGSEVHFDPEAECPRWGQFLEEVFDDDQALVAFMRRLAGYSMTGDVREHVLVVAFGGGANGKSTLVETLKRVYGDHAATAGFDTFMRSRGDRGPRNDVARLHRKRLVTASESGAGRRLDEATIKQLTGGDTVTARYLYGEHFEFRPRFKLWLVTNHRPRVDGDDDAIWRRLRLIPFEVSFKGREDTDLEAALDAELPGILRWCVEGCLEWQRHGLGDAAAVERATREYREDEDTLGAFLADKCEFGGGEVPAGDLRAAYEDFCEELGDKSLGASVLGQQLRKRGITRGGAGRRMYRGVTFR